MKNWINTAKLWAFIVLLLVLLIWEAGVRVFNLPGWLLPSPTMVFISLLHNTSLIVHHSAFTLIKAGIGYAVSVFLAVFLALLFALSPLVPLPFILRSSSPMTGPPVSILNWWKNL